MGLRRSGRERTRLELSSPSRPKWRAAMSIARLLARSGASGTRPAIFWAPVYGWFTEGFDTLDLKEAKALLDELGQ
jgi:hypothetical protein